MTKVGIVSLGCPKNLVDSETMLSVLAQAGCEIVADKNDADVILVNTCGFIEEAKTESIDTILEMTRLKTEGRCRSVVVAGCLAQRYSNELSTEMPEVDAIVGVGQAHALPEIIHLTLEGHRVVDRSRPTAQWVETDGRIRATPAWTAYLKVSDGCDNRCSYCAIPDIRGPFRSRPRKLVLAEAERLAREGVQEIVIVGQDVTRYGEDIGGDLVELLRDLLRVEGPRWYRLMYCYPTRITDELIDLVGGEPRIAKYLDIPLQHGHDETLRRMNRRGSREEYLKLIQRIREACPEIALRTSLMVGFPGETAGEFQSLLEFVKEIRFDRVGVFRYSREEGTPAAKMPQQVSGTVKEGRYHSLMAAQQRISLETNHELIGKEIEVLVESLGESDTAQGRSYRDAPDVDGGVFLSGFRGEPGVFVRTRVKEAHEYNLVAEIIP